MNLYDYELEEKEFTALPENRENMEKSMKRMKDSLRFYQNSMSDRDAARDPMYGIPGAYGLINALLFEGITSERTRVREGKSLHPELLSHMPSLLGAVRDIFYFFTASVMQGKCPAVTLYRTERAAGLGEMIRKGKTVSLTSASKACEFPDYLLEKEGISLLRIQVPAWTPRIDVNALLTEGNLHPEEQEVILPPFLDLEIIREEELFREKIPVCSVRIKVPEEGENFGYDRLSGEDRRKLCDRAALDSGVRVLSAIESGEEPSPQDLEAYLAWKKLFQEAVRGWAGEGQKAARICRDAERLRTKTERQMERGLMTGEEALRIRIENAERISQISGAFISDLRTFADRILALSGLKKEYYDCYPADLGHPQYGPGAGPAFTCFRDLPDLSGEGPAGGEKVCFFVKTADGGRPAWMEVEMTVRKKMGDRISGEISIPGYRGSGDLLTDVKGKEVLLLHGLSENREDPVWKTKRKEPEKRFRLVLREAAHEAAEGL